MKIICIFLSVIFVARVNSCKNISKRMDNEVITRPADTKLNAEKLCRDMILIDGHIDLPYRLRQRKEDISKLAEWGHFDYVRAKKGGLDAPFIAIYIPSRYQKNGAKKYAMGLIDMVEKIISEHPDKFAPANSPADIRINRSKGLISMPLGMENGAALEGDLNNLEVFFDRGIRYITLTHSKDNDICDSSYDRKATWGGLSPFGYQVIKKMNALGMMIDVSHVSDDAFYRIIEASDAPVIASHSSCRHFTPGFERNMSDDMIRLTGEKGGIVMVNFGSSFLSDTARRAWKPVYNKVGRGMSQSNPELKADIDLLIDDEAINGTCSLLADHIDRIVKLAGIDHVGLGSDFDGVIGLPVDLRDVSQYPNLVEELLKRGYAEEDVRKICGGNLMRVWDTVLRMKTN